MLVHDDQLHISVGILICEEIHVYIYYYAENKTKDNNDIDKNAEGCYHNKA